MSADRDPVVGVWAVMVFGNHRVIGCLDPDGSKDNQTKAEAAIVGGEADAFLHLTEAFELLVVPTPQGLSPVQSPYCMLPYAAPWVRIGHIQTLAFLHQMNDATKRVFDQFVRMGREQTKFTQAALAGIKLR